MASASRHCSGVMMLSKWVTLVF
ncbi:hypothetical protein NXF25_010333 [Crotalus adamanteus]|uniref:Uncharacterized protein n=1 Tax=Crotalus adamanteus TaxID=8729 RepID=A0AAW1BJ38_CROAD